VTFEQAGSYLRFPFITLVTPSPNESIEKQSPRKIKAFIAFIESFALTFKLTVKQ